MVPTHAIIINRTHFHYGDEKRLYEMIESLARGIRTFAKCKSISLFSSTAVKAQTISEMLGTFLACEPTLAVELSTEEPRSNQLAYDIVRQNGISNPTEICICVTHTLYAEAFISYAPKVEGFSKFHGTDQLLKAKAYVIDYKNKNIYVL